MADPNSFEPASPRSFEDAWTEAARLADLLDQEFRSAGMPPEQAKAAAATVASETVKQQVARPQVPAPMELPKMPEMAPNALAGRSPMGTLTKPTRMQPPDATGVRAGEFGLPPFAAPTAELRSAPPVSTGDAIARGLMGDNASEQRRKMVEGLTGYTGLGESQNVPISAFGATGVNSLLDYENKLAGGDTAGAAMELAPFAFGAAGRGIVGGAEKALANPKTTAAMSGMLGYFASPTEAGPGDKAPAGESFAPNQDVLRRLYEERATLTRQMDDVRKRRESNRPAGRLPTERNDPQFTAADNEFKGLESRLSGLEATIQEENRRGSPEALAEAKRIQAEADAALAKKRSETPTRELYPDMVANIPYITGAAGLALGAAVKARKTANYNATTRDISDRMADAVDEAYNALAGKRTGPKLAEAQMQTLRAEQLGRELANTKNPGFFDPKVSGIGGLTGVVGAFAPEEIDLARGGKVADKVFESAYDDPMKMAKRAGAGFVMGMAPAEIGGAATWAAMQRRTPPGFGPETTALRDALDRSGVPRYPNQGVLGLPPAVQGGRLAPTPGPQTSNLLPPPGTVLDPGNMPIAGGTVQRNRLAGDVDGPGAPPATPAAATAGPPPAPVVPPSPAPTSKLPEWASEPPANIKLRRDEFWDDKLGRVRKADGTLGEAPKYRATKKSAPSDPAD